MNQRVNWNQGLHRVFALLCLLWVGYLYVYLPHQAIQQATEWAANTGIRHAELERLSPGLFTEEEKAAEAKENWRRASWSYIYKEDIGKNLPVMLGITVLVPAVIYGIIRLSIMLLVWVVRGFKATQKATAEDGAPKT